MRNSLRTLAIALTGTIFAITGSAQITNRIIANINHPFIIGNKTLAPGTYTFRMSTSSELALMNVTSADNKTHFDFSVRQTQAKKIPAHSQLVFRKYGDTEILLKIFEKGSDYGSEVSETNKQEARMAQQGAPVEHTEDIN